MKTTEAGSFDSGLYIHIPYCLQKCRYCDFPSVVLSDPRVLEDYCLCLQEEIVQQSAQHQFPRIETCYFGGGTPSLLSAMQVEQLIRVLHSSFNIQEGAEITLEANPATLSQTKIRDLRDAGINRISLGVQSFSDEDLLMLGRVHKTSEALDTVEHLHALGWNNFNIDLIYGLPGQSIDKWEKNLEWALRCDPAHISAYLLQLDLSTPLAVDLAQGIRPSVAEEDEVAMFNLTREYLQSSGFRHYEISNYCRSGQECRHNMIYWSGKEYLGLGSGAVSFMGARRWMNSWPVESYCQPLRHRHFPPTRVLETMSVDDLVAESLVMGLRLVEGIDLEEIRDRWGIDPRQRYGKLIDDFVQRGWLDVQGSRLRLHPDLIFVSNQILCHFLDQGQS